MLKEIEKSPRKKKLFLDNCGVVIKTETYDENSNKNYYNSQSHTYPHSCKQEKQIRFDTESNENNNTTKKSHERNFSNQENFYSLPKLSTNEYTIESLLGPKKRLPNMQAVRNGLLIISPGDKIYKNVEYQKDYFKQKKNEKKEYNLNINTSKINFYSDMDLNKGSLNPDKVWLNRINKERKEYDRSYIKNLELWEENYLNNKKQSK
jgi:hypothetical protein